MSDYLSMQLPPTFIQIAGGKRRDILNPAGVIFICNYRVTLNQLNIIINITIAVAAITAAITKGCAAILCLTALALLFFALL